MEQQNPQPQEEFVPGLANGHHYMAQLGYCVGGPWSIELIHVEGQAPLSGLEMRWSTRAEAVQAADKLVAALP